MPDKYTVWGLLLDASVRDWNGNTGDERISGQGARGHWSVRSEAVIVMAARYPVKKTPNPHFVSFMTKMMGVDRCL
jgi:hypothetical protein